MRKKTSRTATPKVREIKPGGITMYECERDQLSRLTGLGHTEAERIAWELFRETTVRRLLAANYPRADAQECLLAVLSFRETVVALRPLQHGSGDARDGSLETA